jgi:4-hydroxybenzoate polyprenyltransferase
MGLSLIANVFAFYYLLLKKTPCKEAVGHYRGLGARHGGLVIGLKKTKVYDLPRTALISDALFLVSLVHVHLAHSSIHLTMLGLAGLLLGWSAVPALFIALYLCREYYFNSAGFYH